MVRITSDKDLRVAYFLKTIGMNDEMKKIEWNSLINGLIKKIHAFSNAENLAEVLQSWVTSFQNSEKGENLQSGGIAGGFLVQALAMFFTYRRNGQLNQALLNVQNQLPMPEIQNENEDQNAGGSRG